MLLRTRSYVNAIVVNAIHSVCCCLMFMFSIYFYFFFLYFAVSVFRLMTKSSCSSFFSSFYFDYFGTVLCFVVWKRNAHGEKK